MAALRAASPSEGQCHRVERWLTDAVRDNPTDFALHLQMADLRDLQGRYEEAEAIYRRILAQDRSSVVALNNLAWLLAHRREKAAEALPLISRAIEIAGLRGELLETRAAVHLALGRSDLAVADLEEASADQPTAVRYFQLARAHRAANNSPAAVAALRKAKSLGLATELLHPMERSSYRQLAEELELR
jgi:tetratricopeptide (TPR) repeat protein